MNKVAIVTGATRNLGLALVEGLAQRMQSGDLVYLTGRDPSSVAAAAKGLSGRAEVRGEVLDVSDADAVRAFADLLAERHQGVDIVLSNHYLRIQPDDDPVTVIDDYVAVNNLGTTSVLRSFAPLLREGSRLLVVASRAGTLRALAPALHRHFEDDALPILDEVDAAILRWRDAVRERRAPGQAWPAWINIPSKIGQVAAVRTLARQRRADDLARNIQIAAVSPGLIDTGASRAWLDMTNAQTPAQAAKSVLDLALAPTADPHFYGRLVHFGEVIPWK